MDELGFNSTTFEITPSKLGSAQFDFQQEVNANLAQ
jgi:hypothetical protein